MNNKKKFSLEVYTYQGKTYNTKDTDIDLEEINLKQLHSILKSRIQTKPSRFLFLRSRQHKKIEMDNEQMKILLSSIESFKDLWRGSLNLKAEIIFGPKALELLIQRKRDEYLTIIEQTRTQLLDEKHKQKRIKIETKSLQLDNYTKELTAKAMYETSQAKNQTETARAKILLEAVKVFEKMSPESQWKIVASLSGIIPDDLKDFTEATEKEAVRKQKLENDHEEWKMNEVRKNVNEI